MFDIDFLEEIWATITRNKWRSFMTAMGVFWGIFMLAVMAGAGNGLDGMLRSNVGSVATNSTFIFTERTSLSYGGFAANRSWSFRNGDINTIKSQVDGIDIIAGVVFGYSPNVSYGDKEGSYSTMGHMTQYRDIEPVDMVYGRYINDIDISSRRKVCMIGVQVYQELFNGDGDPVGKLIKIGTTYFTVIGVHNTTSNLSIGGDAKSSIIMPFSTLQQLYGKGDKFDVITITGKDDADVSVIEKQTMSLLKEMHSISPDDKKAMGSANLKETFDLFRKLFMGIAILTWFVGLGTLTAGVVGVSNIMLVTVRERTQEIGVRRAMGATPVKIITQIMSESFILTFVAGILGLTLGVGLLMVADSIIVAQLSDSMNPFSTQLSFGMALSSTFILVLGGLLSGIIPATRAMSISPVDAIREE